MSSRLRRSPSGLPDRTGAFPRRFTRELHEAALQLATRMGSLSFGAVGLGAAPLGGVAFGGGRLTMAGCPV